MPTPRPPALQPEGRAARRARQATTPHGRPNARPNGTSAVSVKQSLSPFWDTRIGADMTVARQGTLTASGALSEKLANGGSAPQSSGTAWAAITAPGVASIWDKTSVEARVDPGTGAEQARHLPEQVGAAQRAIFADAAERLQFDPAGHRAGARHRQPSLAQLRDRRSRRNSASSTPAPASSPGRPCRPPTTNGCARSAPSKNCSTASPSRARSARPRPAPPTRASAPASSAAGKRVAEPLAAPVSRMIQHCRILAQMRSNSAAQMAPLHFVVRGTSALAFYAKQRNSR